LVDIFLRIATYPLQSHWRTTVAFFSNSQIETDDLLVGVDRHGTQYVIPIQAKGEKEPIGVVQVIQDAYRCVEKFRGLCCRPVAAKTVKRETQPDGYEVYTIALLEMGLTPPWDVYPKRQKHYQLVQASKVTVEELQQYRQESLQADQEEPALCLELPDIPQGVDVAAPAPDNAVLPPEEEDLIEPV
jgi:hypothetical protein